jgi:hypothetical protein
LGGYLANTFNPGVPFLVYAPLLVFSAALLAMVGEGDIRPERDSMKGNDPRK